MRLIAILALFKILNLIYSLFTIKKDFPFFSEQRIANGE